MTTAPTIGFVHTVLSQADEIAAEAASRYRRETGREPVPFTCRAADGARVTA